MPIADIRARTAARKSEGADQEYPHHATGERAPARIPLPVVAPCRHEGAIIERCPSCAGAGRHVRECRGRWKECTREPIGTARMNCVKCRAEGLGYEPG